LLNKFTSGTFAQPKWTDEAFVIEGVIFIGVSHTVGLIRLGQPTLKI